MKQFWFFIFSYIFRPLVRIISTLTGKGAGKFAAFLPKGQKYVVKKYCNLYKFNVDTTYPIESCIWLSGVYDVVTTKFLRKILRSGDVFLDIGANCGALTLVAASSIGNGKIYAFEPGKSIRSRLQANIELNLDIQNIVAIVPLGLGSTKGQMLYHEDRNYPGNGALHATYNGTPVEVISLDEWAEMAGIHKIDAIKIDVEGMEYDVLMGAKAVLEKYQPIVYFETLDIFFKHTPYQIRNLYEFLLNLGYKIVTPTSPHLPIPLDGPYPSNSVAVPPSKAERLGLK